MNPMHECRGLCLASAATQTGSLSSLSSSTDTSESFDSRHHDKVPVLTQNLPDEQHSHLCVVLPWQSGTLIPCYQEPNYSFGGQCPNCLSLRMHASVCQECLGRDQSVFRQHAQSSTHVPNVQVVLCLLAARLTSPWLCARGITPRFGET